MNQTCFWNCRYAQIVIKTSWNWLTGCWLWCRRLWRRGRQRLRSDVDDDGDNDDDDSYDYDKYDDYDDIDDNDNDNDDDDDNEDVINTIKGYRMWL